MTALLEPEADQLADAQARRLLELAASMSAGRSKSRATRQPAHARG